MLKEQTVELLPARTTMKHMSILRNGTVVAFNHFVYDNIGTVGTNNGLSIGAVYLVFN